MAIVTTRQGLIDYALRSLGSPVIQINGDATQWDDRVDDALQMYSEAHYDATTHDYLAYTVQQADIDNGYITLPDDILTVQRIMPAGGIGLTTGGFASPEYQMSVSALRTAGGNFTFDSLSLFMVQQQLDQFAMLTRDKNLFDYHRHMDRLVPHLDMANDYIAGETVLILEVYTIIDPETHSQIYNDKWLKDYVTQSIKRQWGENLKKMGGVQLIGGVTLNGKEIWDEAVEALKELKLELEEKYQAPPFFLIG